MGKKEERSCICRLTFPSPKTSRARTEPAVPRVACWDTYERAFGEEAEWTGLDLGTVIPAAGVPSVIHYTTGLSLRAFF